MEQALSWCKQQPDSDPEGIFPPHWCGISCQRCKSFLMFHERETPKEGLYDVVCSKCEAKETHIVVLCNQCGERLEVGILWTEAECLHCKAVNFAPSTGMSFGEKFTGLVVLSRLLRLILGR